MNIRKLIQDKVTPLIFTDQETRDLIWAITCAEKDARTYIRHLEEHDQDTSYEKARLIRYGALFTKICRIKTKESK